MRANLVKISPEEAENAITAALTHGRDSRPNGTGSTADSTTTDGGDNGDNSRDDNSRDDDDDDDDDDGGGGGGLSKKPIRDDIVRHLWAVPPGASGQSR